MNLYESIDKSYSNSEYPDGSGNISKNRNISIKNRLIPRKKDTQIKHEMPNPDEKNSIRVQIFKFLDQSREEQIELVYTY
jgi:hypothetical protein